MGEIVFSTIIENVKSFFGREDELLAKPKGVPESASEVFERPGARPTASRIVERPLPENAKPAPLPFSPDQLRDALNKQKVPATVAQPASPPPAPRYVPPVVEEREIAQEIDAFESALRDAHSPVSAKRDLARAVAAEIVPTTSPRRERTPTQLPDVQESAFDSFDRFLVDEDLSSDGVLDKDILHRLREFHKHKREGKQYYLYTKDVKAAIARKIGELKLLEREWLGTREELDDLEHGLTAIEQEIESRSRDLKDLLAQAKTTTRLEKSAPIGQEFALRDGRRLSTLLDLKIALRTMPEDIFRHHVFAGRNDFASWTRSALGEAVIADEMARINDRHELAVMLGRVTG